MAQFPHCVIQYSFSNWLNIFDLHKNARMQVFKANNEFYNQYAVLIKFYELTSSMHKPLLHNLILYPVSLE